MAEVTLRAEKRSDTGKGSARRTRAAGKVPAILYGRGIDPVALQVDRREFVSALKTDAGMNVLLDLKIDGTTTLAMTRELQRDPVRGTLLHADLLRIDRDQQIEVEVPVHLVGHAPGMEAGGILEHPLFTVHVKTRPTEVPESVQADISSLNIGDSVKVGELQTGGRFEITNDPDTVVAQVAAPITEEQLEAMEAEAGIEHEAPEEEAEAAEVPEGEEGEAAEGEAPAAEEE
jgi:large subunit ribosomal protein L25